MELKNNKLIYYTIIGIALTLVLSIGVTFAIFTSQANKNIELVTTGTLQIRYIESSTITANSLKPATLEQVKEAYLDGSCIYAGDRTTNIQTEKICAYKTFTITNIGTLTAYTNVMLEDITNTYQNLKYQLFETSPATLSGSSLLGVNELVNNIELLPNDNKIYTLLIWLDESATMETDKNKSYTAKITVNANTSNALILEDPSNANRPVLADGMIPVKYNDTTWVKANAMGDYNEWYDYQNKMWANAVMVSSETRDAYMALAVGEPVNETDILAYYVWIPRYKYQLFNVEFKVVDEQLINVVFESGTSSTGNVTCTTSEIGVETCTNKTNGNWYTHPAFTFGEDELEGIWVGKFETTYGTNTTNVYPDKTVYENPTIKPNVTALRNQQVSKQFETSQYFGTSTYLTSVGVNEVDAHMMKNGEWGAVAYLKQSSYGLGITDIGINTNNGSGGYLTGCGLQSVGSLSDGSKCNAYNTELGMVASTTGNITGIYDMSGGTNEYTMGVMQDRTTINRSPMSGSATSGNSGYIGKVSQRELDKGYFDSPNTLAFPNAKYYDLYANGISATDYTRSHLGDATGETRGWYGDSKGFVSESTPWFIRGARNFNDVLAGIFHFTYGGGSNETTTTFRIVLSNVES